jgi:hypothetical protein
VGHVAGRYLEVRIVVGWSRSGGGHATGLEGTSSAQYSEIHTTGWKKNKKELNTTTNNTDANTSSTTISDYQQQQQHNTASTISNTH